MEENPKINIYLNRAAFGLLLALVPAVALFFSTEGEFVIGKELVARIAIYSSLFLFLVSVGFSKFPAFARFQIFPDALIFLAGFIPSLIAALDHRRAFISWLGFLDGVVLYFLVIGLVDSRKRKNIFIMAFYLSALLVSVGGILQVLNVVPLGYDLFRKGDPGSSLGLSNFAAEYLLLCLPLLFVWAVPAEEKDHGLLTLVKFLGIVVIGLYFLLTQNRGAMAGMAVAGVFFAIVMLRSWVRFRDQGGTRLKPVLIGTALVLAVSGVFLFLTPAGSRVVKKSLSSLNFHDPSIRFRFLAWESSLKMFKDNTFFGVGLANYPLSLPKYQTADLDRMAEQTGTTVDNPHNEFLFFLSETGLVGFFFWLVFLFSVFLFSFRELKRSRNFSERIFAGGILAGFWGFLANSFFAFNFHLPASSLAFFGLVGLMEAESRLRQEVIPLLKVEPAGAVSPKGWKILGKKHSRIAIFAVSILVLISGLIWVRATWLEYDGRLAFLRGMRAAGQGNIDDSLPYFNRAIQRDPHNYIYYYNRSISYGFLGMQNETEEDLLKTLSLHPNMVSALYDLGAMRTSEGRYQEAEEPLELALALNPSLYFEIGVHLSQVYLNLGDLSRAQEIGARLVEIRDDSFLSHFLLANAYYFSRDYPSATREYFETIKLNPNFADGFKNLGLSLLQEERAKEALAIYENATGKWPERAELWYYLGCALAEDGRKAEAEKQLQQAFSLDSGLKERARQEPILIKKGIKIVR
ncbi:MAG: O-antigen ligase family protein [bacterium]|nr:O-antigen ligase family protein [bacterium]